MYGMAERVAIGFYLEYDYYKSGIVKNDEFIFSD
jgi:hypothetical protein